MSFYYLQIADILLDHENKIECISKIIIIDYVTLFQHIKQPFNEWSMATFKYIQLN